jgi:hypothetical protein
MRLFFIKKIMNMKKFSLIIILFFNILPMWKNEEVIFLQVCTIQGQASQAMALPQLVAYLRSIDFPYPNNRYAYNVVGNAVSRVDLTTNIVGLVHPADYNNNTGFNQYLASHNVILPPASNEYPDPSPDGDVDWNQVKHDLDILKFETRMQMFAEIVWFNGIAGNEPQNPPPPCEESMYNISPLDDDFYEGKAVPFINQASISLAPPNNPCSNNFLIGGNIIHFNTTQLANISNYNFFDNKLHSVDMLGNRHYRAVNYDVIESKTQYDSYSSYCPDDHYDSTYMLLNKRGSYQFICFDNLPVEGLRQETYTTVSFFKDVPINEAGISFTIPDSAIVPAQQGDIVLGLDSSNAFSCQSMDLTDSHGFYFSRIAQLDSMLDNNESVIPCDSLLIFNTFGNMFLNVSSFQAPPQILNRLDSIKNNTPDFDTSSLFIQNINDAFSVNVNCDFFPVKINQLPKNSLGVQMSPLEFLEYFRKNLNTFSTSQAVFSPYNANGLNDSIQWNKDYSLSVGAIVHIAMTIDGSVILTDYSLYNSPTYSTNSFIFSTLVTPFDGYHPVSGNRKFGIYTDSTGGFVFYTMGVDRISRAQYDFGSFVSDVLTGSSGFDRADELWTGMQNNLIQFINDNEGSANNYTRPNYITRPNWFSIQAFLKKQITLQQLKDILGC